MTLVGPPEVKLRDKLVDNAVHDYHEIPSIKVLSDVWLDHISFLLPCEERTLRIANAKPSIDLYKSSH
jgi:hypothetical protein